MRRVVVLRCEVVSLCRYQMLATEVLDVSGTGLLVSSDADAEKSEPVVVHLFTGEDDIVAAAEVSRVVRGLRREDRGEALGLRFTRVPGAPLRRLLRQLHGTPPPVPRRPIRCDYAASVRAIAAGRPR
jgi:hypothetical protein